MLRRTALALSLLPLAPACWAADATPEQAQALERQVQEWASGLAGAAIKLPDRPVQITAAGDHYNIAVPIGVVSSGAPPMLTASARLVDGGKWSIDGIRFPSPAEFTINMPVPAKPGEKAQGGPIQVAYRISADQQSGQILWDPTFATQSTASSSFQGLRVEANGPGLQQSSRVDRAASTGTMRPAGADRVDVMSDGTMEGYTISSKTADSEQVKLSMQRVHVTGQFNGVSRERASQAMQAIVQLSGTVMANASSGSPPAPGSIDPKLVRDLLRTLGDLATGFSVEESFDKLALSYGDFGGTLNSAQLGFGAKTERGILQARMDLGMEGLALPDLPLGEMAVLIPTKVALRPALTGIAMADLMRLLDATADGKDPSQADIAALFSRGGISAGLESFTVDVAGSSIGGMGKLVFTSPQVFAGTAQITATNFDLLQQRVSAMPALAQQAMPVFIFLKGIGRATNNQMVWDVSYKDNRLLINNQDLTALMGGPPPPQQQPARPNQQRPQQQNRPRQ